MTIRFILGLSLSLMVCMAAVPALAQSSRPRTIGEAMQANPQLKQSMLAQFEQTKKKAELGDPEAQLHLGFFYENGSVTPKSETNAVYWIRKGGNSRTIGAAKGE